MIMQMNQQFDLAFNFLQNTGTHLFLTGKAGTGKTTFLKKLKEVSPKRMIVVAPTGVAALTFRRQTKKEIKVTIIPINSAGIRSISSGAWIYS